MGIKEDIKTSKFSCIQEETMINIIYTCSWLNSFQSRFKKFGISSQQYNVLRILRGSHPQFLRLADITERMIDKMSNATRLVEKLRQKGLVNREICPDNRRQVNISITPSGMDLLTQIENHPEANLCFMNALSIEELQTLSTLLDKLRKTKS